MAFACIENLTGIGTVQTTEVGGVFRNHSSTYLVTGTADDFGTDEKATLTVLRSTINGLPLPGSSMLVPPVDQATFSTTTSKMFVIGRRCRMEGPLNALVDVTWQQFETSLNHPDGIGAVHSVGTKTVTTTRDRSGEPILVALGTDEATGAPHQGTITVMDPEPVYSIELALYVPQNVDPAALTNYYVGTVNSGRWRELPKGSWLCTECTPRPMAPYSAPPELLIRRYIYAFKFIASTYGNGWNPSVEWIAPDTRMPPAKLEPDVGRKLIDWYPGRDFDHEPRLVVQTLGPQ